MADTDTGSMSADSPEGLRFTDFNVKLAVIEELMYVQERLRPKFDVRSLPGVDLTGDSAIEATVQHFRDLVITADDAARVTELAFDGGNDVYRQIIPQWDGEDDTFEPGSWDDLALLPNLERVVLLMTEDPESIAEELEARGLEVEW